MANEFDSSINYPENDQISNDDELLDFTSRPFTNKADVEQHIQRNEEGEFKKMEQISEDKSRFDVAKFNFRYKDLENNHGFEVVDCSQNEQRSVY